MGKENEHQDHLQYSGNSKKKTSEDNEINLLPLKPTLLGHIVQSKRTINGPSYLQWYFLTKLFFSYRFCHVNYRAIVSM